MNMRLFAIQEGSGEFFIAAQAEVDQEATEEALKVKEEQDSKIQSQGEYELFGVDCNHQERQVRIEKKLPEYVRLEVQNILTKFQDIFSWSPTDKGKYHVILQSID